MKKKKKSEGEHDKFLSESNKRIYPLGDGNYTNETIERKHEHCSIDIQPSKQPSRWNYSSRTVVIGITRNFLEKIK